MQELSIQGTRKKRTITGVIIAGGITGAVQGAHHTGQPIELAEFADDYITRRMVEEFIVDEQEHTNWLAEDIGLIEEIGYQNYLIQQM